MDDRLSFKAVDDYSEDFASKAAAAFFSKKGRITGPEILKLCTIHQVNLFVVRELLAAWQHEGQKLQSPYFDYSAKEVRDELARMQSILSNHISIDRENFQPLLKKAVSQTLFLIIDPYDYYSDVLDRKGSKHVRTSDLKSDIKYLRINRPPLEKLVQRLEERKLDLIAGKEAFAMLDQILEEVNFNPEDVESYIEEFSKVVPLKYEQLYEPRTVASVPKAVTAAPAPAAPARPAKATAGAEARTLADSFQRISSIKDSLTINQKFMFTKILFKGDFENFSGAVEKVDRFTSLAQALKYLDDSYPDWDKESEEYEEFIELVNKRFA
jgi:hypothetical protein